MVKISKLKFGQNLKMGQNFIMELSKIFKAKFGQNLDTEVGSTLKVELCLKKLRAKFGQNLETEVWSIF